MFSVVEALEAVLAQSLPLPEVRLPLVRALGHLLRDEIRSDIDSPPHDKSLVDGYAVRAADFVGGRATLRVVEEITAGAVGRLTIAAGTAARIMTGAPVPSGADSVVMVERMVGPAPTNDAIAAGAAKVALADERIKAGQNIMLRGASLRRGQVVLTAGTALRAMEIGALAEVGQATVAATRRPSVAVMATGNELVATSAEIPAAGSIRNSNGPMLAAAAVPLADAVDDLGIARDDRASLQAMIERGLAADVLLLSGGVSAGVLDLVPEVLRSAGVREVFHRVRFKPGKPLWFGVRNAERPTLVFGLPGNPVGAYVCFELFVRPALRKLAGVADVRCRLRQAQLTAAFTQRGDRPVYHPATLVDQSGTLQVTPLPWHGSSDLAGFTKATALIEFPAGERTYAPGELVAVYALS
jgi:molybdopterin molybdotransferase